MLVIDRLHSSLTSGSFRTWLSRNEPAAVVGRVGRPNHCPLARYLREVTGIPVTVDATEQGWYVFHTWGEPIPLPWWAAKFAARERKLGGLDYKVRASQALQILDEILGQAL